MDSTCKDRQTGIGKTTPLEFSLIELLVELKSELAPKLLDLGVAWADVELLMGTVHSKSALNQIILHSCGFLKKVATTHLRRLSSAISDKYKELVRLGGKVVPRDKTATESPTALPTHHPTQHDAVYSLCCICGRDIMRQPTVGADFVARCSKGCKPHTFHQSMKCEGPMPTTVPTEAPTAMPSTLPTITPTSAPTVAPTAAPSSTPTTAVPTAAPTLAPSFGPTPVPTPPTSQPTQSPSAVPTTSPSSAPSVFPTKAPTDHTGPPTLAPTAAPTLRYLKVGDKLYEFNFTLAVVPTAVPTQAPTTHAQKLQDFASSLGDLLDSITEIPTALPTFPPTGHALKVQDATTAGAVEARTVANKALHMLMLAKSKRIKESFDGNNDGGSTISAKSSVFFDKLLGVLHHGVASKEGG